MQDKIFSEFSASSDYIKKVVTDLVGGKRIIDLLLFPPAEYRILSVLTDSTPKLEGSEVIADILIISHEPSFKISPKSPYKIISEFDDGTPLTILFFAGNAGMWKAMFKENIRYKIACKLQKFGGCYQTTHPKILRTSIPEKQIQNDGVLFPRYPLTGNLTQNIVKNLIEKHLKLINIGYDWLQDALPLKDALNLLHSPATLLEAEKARKRLAFDELLGKNLAFLIANFNVNCDLSPRINLNQNSLSDTLRVLPFELTNDQHSALKQILNLQDSPKQTSVLLQGDVGSGKTVIAILAAINAALNGFQVAIMSPTVILARQTFESFAEITSYFDMPILFFSADDKGRKRAQKLADISQNNIKIIIGTHALFSSDVVFANLGYVIIDEQHRFGINQRLALTAKSSGVKTLLMTATPIPRTLSMALFGDIEVAYIKQKPQNRKQIITKLFSNDKIPEIIDGVKRKMLANEQTYWVVPFIEEGEDDEKRNGISIQERLRTLKEHFLESEISVVHGKMKESDLLEEMAKFKSGEKKIMLATTVIEVGVNVPSATLIIIESAENFGLSSLHQLRGRVGRGDLQSYCFLIAGSKSEATLTRLKTITSSNDGFVIAEKDMEIRGSGAIFSKMQSGFEAFRFVKISKDQDIVKKAKLEAKKIFESDPNLESQKGLKIRNLMKFYNYDVFIKYFKI